MKVLLSLLPLIFVFAFLLPSHCEGKGFFGIAPGAETGGYFPQLFPLLKEAGVGWVRGFPEWVNIQPREGEWHFESADAWVKSAKENGLDLLGIFLYVTPWASSGGDTRTFPLKDIKYWRDYVEGILARYHNDIKYWEVYNEFASFSKNGTPKDYAQLVVTAYEVGRKVDPTCRIGLNWNEFDMSSLQRVIEEGAGGHFDFVCVHPYAMLDRVMKGREEAFLGMMKNFRRMLRITGQREDIPLWVSEVGRPAKEHDGESEQKQAEALIKAYTLCLAQGIERVFWFEGRGPTYGPEGSFGIVRDDWSKRPSFYALQILTNLFGPQPRYLGWLNLAENARCFVIQGNKEAVCITWTVGEGNRIRLPSGVRAFDLLGKPIEMVREREVLLTNQPIFLSNLPRRWVQEARENKNKLFAWMKDYSKAKESSWRMEEGKDVMEGLYLIDWQDGRDIVGPIDGAYARRTDRGKQHFYIEFDVDDSFASLGDRELEVTVVARRLNPDQPAGCNLIYESLTGYKHIDDWWTIPPEPGWHQHTFRIRDANFANCWGWNFCVSVVASPGDIYLKEVIVKKAK